MVDSVSGGRPPYTQQAGGVGVPPGAARVADLSVAVPPTRSASVEVRRELGGLAADMAASPPVDSGKVDRLRTMIANGLYKVEPERIADAMIGQETRSL